MWPAYEDRLKNQLLRLDRLISESESLASRTTDDETIRAVDADLARWRMSKTECETALHRMNRAKRLNSFASWSLTAFGASIAAIFVPSIIGKARDLSTAYTTACLVLFVGSSIVYVCVATVRDTIIRGKQPWRFSMRELMITMTVIAIVLGLIAYSSRLSR